MLDLDGNPADRFSHNLAHLKLRILSQTKSCALVVIIIIILSIFKEDDVFSITASLPYGPPVNTDIDYYQTFFGLVYFASVARLVVQYFVRRREASTCLIMLSTKQGSHWYHF